MQLCVLLQVLLKWRVTKALPLYTSKFALQVVPAHVRLVQVPKQPLELSQDSVFELNASKKLHQFRTTVHVDPAAEEAEEYSLFIFNLSLQKN
jgi:thiol:disulfide interchange protein